MKTDDSQAFYAVMAYFRRHFWAFCLAFLGLAPVVASAQSQTCKVWLASDLKNQAELIKVFSSKGYSVLMYGEDSSRELREGDLVISVEEGRWQRSLLSVVFSDRLPHEYGPLTTNLPQFPACTQHEAIMTEAYFKTYYGEMARRWLDTPPNGKVDERSLGNFILEVEALKQEGYSKFVPVAKRYKKVYADILRRVISLWRSGEKLEFKDRIDRVREFLSPYTENYLALLNHLSLLLTDPQMGNCVSTTLLYTTLFHDAHIELESHQEFALQLFQDHIQPVIWDHKTDKVVSLVAGTEEKWNGGIYKPDLIVWALANEAGRAMHSEREFFLKRRYPDFKYISFNLGAAYALGFRDGGHAGGSLPYLKFDNSLSLYSDQPSPTFGKQPFGSFGSPPVGDKATIIPNPEVEQLLKEFGLVGGSGGKSLTDLKILNMKDVAKLKELLQTLKDGKEGAGAGRGGFGPRGAGSADAGAGDSAARDEDESLARKMAERFNSKIWAQIPSSQRPPPPKQLELSAAYRRLTGYQYNDQPSISYYALRPFTPVRAADPDELEQFQFDFPILVKGGETGPIEKVEIEGKTAAFFPSDLQIIVRHQADLRKMLGESYDPAQVFDGVGKLMQQAFDEMKPDISAIDLLIKALDNFKDRAAMPSSAELEPGLQLLRRARALREMRDSLPYMPGLRVGQSDISQWLEAQNYCELIKELSELGKSIEQRPREYLKYLESLAPELAYQKLRFLSEVVESNWFDNGTSLAFCRWDGNKHYSTRDTLLPLLNHLIVSHESDPTPKQRRPPQLIEIELVFGGDLPGKIVEVPRENREAQAGVPWAQGNAPAETNDSKDSEERAQAFDFRTDIIVDVLFAQESRVFANWAVKLKAFAWWNKEAQITFERHWADRRAQEYNDLWKMPNVNLMKSALPKAFHKSLHDYESAAPLAASGAGFDASMKLRPEVLEFLRAKSALTATSYHSTQVEIVPISKKEGSDLQESQCNGNSLAEIGTHMGRKLRDYVREHTWMISSSIMRPCNVSPLDQNTDPTTIVIESSSMQPSGSGVVHSAKTLYVSPSTNLSSERTETLSKAIIDKAIEESDKANGR